MQNRFLLSGFACAFALPAAAHAQEVSLNYDRLSSFEEPLAVSLGDVTIHVQGVLDAPVIAEFDEVTGSERIEVEFVTNFQASAQVQLRNRWTLGAVYFGQYSNCVKFLNIV